MGLHGQKLPAHPPSTQVNSRGKQLHSLLERLSLFSTPRGTQYGPFGTTTTPVPSKMVFIGVANGPITARVGDTMGIGQVNVVQPNATWAGGPPPTLTQVIGATLVSATYWVAYASSNTLASGNGIDSGTYCAVEQDMFGQLWVAPMDCGQ